MKQDETTIEVDEQGEVTSYRAEIPMDQPAAAEVPTETPEVAPEAPASLELAPPAAEERPEWLDPKFKSPADMAAAYKELERKLGQPAQKPTEKPADKKADAPAATELTEGELAAYSAEVTASGKLSEASYAALAKKGLPKALVDSHVAGLQALRQSVMDKALGAVGGADGYKKIAAWAVDNLPPEAQRAYNADVNSGDPARVQYAVEGLQARFAAATGAVQPARIHGRRAPAGAQGFRSKAEQVAAIQDPRYWSDAGYRKEVERMTMASGDLE